MSTCVSRRGQRHSTENVTGRIRISQVSSLSSVIWPSMRHISWVIPYTCYPILELKATHPRIIHWENVRLCKIVKWHFIFNRAIHMIGALPLGNRVSNVEMSVFCCKFCALNIHLATITWALSSYSSHAEFSAKHGAGNGVSTGC